jgi:hypothetical protein
MAKKYVRAKQSTTGYNKAMTAIAILEQRGDQAQQILLSLGDKFDRILSRVEEMALHTTTLITRHDEKIQNIEKQSENVEQGIGHLRDELAKATTFMTKNMEKEVSAGATDIGHAIDKFMEETEKRVERVEARLSILERWKWAITGGVAVIAAILSNLKDIIQWMAQ